jgi:hypothetical protein
MPRCTAITRAGNRCQNPATAGERCHVHAAGRETGETRHARAKAAAKTRKTADDWREPFLEAFRASGMVTDACRAAGVSRATAYRRRQADEDFALAWADAERDVLALLEDEAVRRALQGTPSGAITERTGVEFPRQQSDYRKRNGQFCEAGDGSPAQEPAEIA